VAQDYIANAGIMVVVVVWTKVNGEGPVVGPFQHGITALHSNKRKGISYLDE
jgi:hypothetical protein